MNRISISTFSLVMALGLLSWMLAGPVAATVADAGLLVESSGFGVIVEPAGFGVIVEPAGFGVIVEPAGFTSSCYEDRGAIFELRHGGFQELLQ